MVVVGVVVVGVKKFEKYKGKNKKLKQKQKQKQRRVVLDKMDDEQGSRSYLLLA